MHKVYFRLFMYLLFLEGSKAHVIPHYICVPCTSEASRVMKRLGLKSPREHTVGQLVQKR